VELDGMLSKLSLFTIVFNHVRICTVEFVQSDT